MLRSHLSPFAIRHSLCAPVVLFAIRIGFLRRGGKFLTLFNRLLDGADHVERLLRQVIVFALAQPLEAADGIGELDKDEQQRFTRAIESGGMNWPPVIGHTLYVTKQGDLYLVVLSLVEKRTQSRDHPILLDVPETYYLKCLILRKL